MYATTSGHDYNSGDVPRQEGVIKVEVHHDLGVGGGRGRCVVLQEERSDLICPSLPTAWLILQPQNAQKIQPGPPETLLKEPRASFEPWKPFWRQKARIVNGRLCAWLNSGSVTISTAPVACLRHTAHVPFKQRLRGHTKQPKSIIDD